MTISLIVLSVIIVTLIALIILLHKFSKKFIPGRLYYSHKLGKILHVHDKIEKFGLCLGVYAQVNHHIYDEDELKYYSIFYMIENKFNEIGND